jgi:hypothetical protein
MSHRFVRIGPDLLTTSKGVINFNSQQPPALFLHTDGEDKLPFEEEAMKKIIVISLAVIWLAAIIF